MITVKMMAKQRRLPTTAAIITIALQSVPSPTDARKQKYIEYGNIILKAN